MNTITTVLTDKSWSRLFVIIVVAFIISLAFHTNTAISIVNIWSTSETFAHGFFVLPIFLWLLYRKRAELSLLPITPNWTLVPFLILTGAFWLVSSFAGLQVGLQLALVLTVILSIAILIGKEITKKILFPLAFLLFMAPVGEEIVPQLMEITADMTVYAVKLTGIPIYREGLFFSLPSGNWSVVEACSGIRYLIASLMLGSLFAYLNFESTNRRVLFIVLSAVIPILANGVRAYMIVMLGHLSNNKIATGVDHLVYGWLFFGLVMFILFSVGAVLAKGEKNQSRNQIPDRTVAQDKSYKQIAMISILCIAIWPIWNSASSNFKPVNISELDNPFGALADTKFPTTHQSLTTWQPLMSGQDATFTTLFNLSPDDTVRGTAYVFVEQYQGKEMISSGNTLVHTSNETWRATETSLFTLTGPRDSATKIQETIIRSNSQSIRVWRWYVVGNKVLANPVKTKLVELVNRVMLRRTKSSTVILVGDYEQSDSAMKQVAAELIWPLQTRFIETAN